MDIGAIVNESIRNVHGRDKAHPFSYNSEKCKEKCSFITKNDIK